MAHIITTNPNPTPAAAAAPSVPAPRPAEYDIDTSMWTSHYHQPAPLRSGNATSTATATATNNAAGGGGGHSYNSDGSSGTVTRHSPDTNSHSDPNSNDSSGSGGDSPRDDSANSDNARFETAPVAASAEPDSNLFVSGLAPTVDDAALMKAFEPFGSVLSAKVMLRVATGVSRGFGFVLFEKAAQADAALAAMHGGPIEGHGGRLQVTVSKHRGEIVSRVVFIRNVPSAVAASPRLLELLRSFGHVERSVARTVSNGELVNFTVTYDTIECARACVNGLHGKTPFPECASPLMAKMEEPANVREERLRAIERKRREQQQAIGTSSSASSQPPMPAARRSNKDRANAAAPAAVSSSANLRVSVSSNQGPSTHMPPTMQNLPWQMAPQYTSAAYPGADSGYSNNNGGMMMMPPFQPQPQPQQYPGSMMYPMPPMCPPHPMMGGAFGMPPPPMPQASFMWPGPQPPTSYAPQPFAGMMPPPMPPMPMPYGYPAPSQ